MEVKRGGHNALKLDFFVLHIVQEGGDGSTVEGLLEGPRELRGGAPPRLGRVVHHKLGQLHLRGNDKYSKKGSLETGICLKIFPPFELARTR
jgi:hypothetical protein